MGTNNGSDIGLCACVKLKSNKSSFNDTSLLNKQLRVLPGFTFLQQTYMYSLPAAYTREPGSPSEHLVGYDVPM